MNKTHGLVATAWMLGSGLLLNASLTAQAQISPPPASEEYYAPQRTVLKSSVPAPPKKAPGLLPEAIRNADASNSGMSVRPLAPSNSSLNAGRKINGLTPAPTRPTNRTPVMPANHEQNEATIQPTFQSDAAPSPVQKQLEELYRKDGRPMPQMSFQQTPLPSNGQAANGNNNGRPNNAAPSKPRSLLDKLNPFSRSRTAPAPLPQHPANPIPNNAVRLPQMPPNAAPMAKGIPSNGVNPAGANRAGLPVVPARVQQPAAQGGSQLSTTLPPVPGDPGYAAPAKNGETAIAPPAPASIDEALENAFTDLPETKVDEKTEAAEKPVESEPAANENPFSGLSLDDEFGPATKPAAIESAKPAATKTDDSQADEAAKEAVKSKTSTDNGEETPSDEIPLPPEALPAEPVKEEVDAKMKLIAERGELRGLKGFCPVALRDDRDLKNALPEHHSTYKGRTYYFSTADAKTAFDEHPQQYAPIAGGQDVVLLKEKVTKEGSLDHAVWFKDRLYLFTSQKTLEQFVATPKEFAITE